MANIFKSLIDKITGTKSANITTTYQLTDRRFEFFEYNNQTYHIDFTNQSNILKAIKLVPQLTAIVNKKAQRFNNGKYQIVNRGNEKQKTQGGQFRSIFKLLENPNPFQTDAQFRANVYYFIQVFGFCPVLAMKGFDLMSGEQSIQKMFVLPPQFLKFTMKHNVNYFGIENIKDAIEKITFDYDGQTVLPLEDVYFLTDITANISNYLMPESRLSAISQPLSNLINNYEAVNEILYNRGAMGILSNVASGNNNVLPMDPSEKQDVHDEWGNYGLKSGQKKIIITNASLQWQKIGLNFNELGLNELYDRDVKDIANGLNFPVPLLTMDGSTFNNQNTAEKSLYENAIIPEAINYTQQLTDMLMTNPNYKIVLDFQHLEVLQDDKLKQAQRKGLDIRNAQSLFNLNSITYNRMLELSGEPTITGMDKYKYELSFYNATPII